MTAEMKVRLFPGGPEFPAEFLDLIQSGQVVFFCGAGLSMGTGLPDFSGLVQELDEKLNSDPADRFDYSKRTDCDRMLDELERQFSGGRESMCEHIRDILSRPPSDPGGILSPDEVLQNHRNILKLAAVPDGGFRLVTTNFDDRFARASGGAIESKDWPELPSLKDGQWASLVHLHGRIRDDARPENLILTASDFGDAYIRDHRAANFVIDLLRRWPVAFVSYDLNDPPMDYLIRAVYDARNSPKMVQPAFALVGYEEGEKDKQRREWKEKRVVPILYNNADGYKALREILDHLARLKDEPEYRTELAIRGIDGNPDDEGGDHGRRVIWALRDSVVARDFNKSKMFMDPKDGSRFVCWLNAIKDSGLFRVNSAIAAKATINPLFSSDYVPLSPVAEYLADWIARHAHQPALLWWLSSENMSLHPRFVKLLAYYVKNGAGSENKMPDSLAEKWQLFIQERSVPPPSDTLFPAWAVESKLVKSNLEQHILSALRPQVRIVQRRPSLFREIHGEFNVDVTVDCGVECVNMMTELREWEVREWMKRSDFVVRYAEVLSAHLEGAASLAERCGVDIREPHCFHPDKDNRKRYSYFGFLARLVRDAVRGMIKAEDVSRLKHFVCRWMSDKHILLRRLALYSITETAELPNDKRLPADWGAKILMTHPDDIWNPESQGEILRFLRKAGADMTPTVRAELEGVICKGQSHHVDGPEKGITRPMPRKIIVRLAKLEVSLRQSGMKLSPASAHMLANARNADPKAKFEDAMESASIGGLRAMPKRMLPERAAPMERGSDPKWAEMTVGECANCMQSAEWPNVRAFVIRHPDKAVDVFGALAKREFWDRDKWSPFLFSFGGDKNILDGLAARLIRLLEAMPDELARSCVRDYAYLLEVISRTRPFSEIEAAWRKAWNFDLGTRSILADAPDDDLSTMSVINHAHGILTTAALIRFGRGEKRESLLDLYAEILASEKPSHKHGKIIIGGHLFLWFSKHPEWAKRNLLPFFKPEHPMAFSMWEEFLQNPGWSAKLLAVLEPGLMHFIKRADDFNRIENLVGLFVIGGMQHPEIICQNEQRRVIAGMSSKGIQHLCLHMEHELHDGDNAERAKTWREKIFPFLRDMWPERRRADGESSDISQALASLVMSTGDAFPDAFKWAKRFLSPIIGAGQGHGMHLVGSFLYGHQEYAKNIQTKFPRECLFFLHRIIPNEEFPWHLQDRLNHVLDKMKAAAPDLEKRPEFIRLRKIASGG